MKKSNYSRVAEEKEKKQSELDFCLCTTIKNDIIMMQ